MTTDTAPETAEVNYPTWHTALVMANDEPTYYATRDAARQAWARSAGHPAHLTRMEDAVGLLADALPEVMAWSSETRDLVALLGPDRSALLTWAMEQVDWRHIAADLLADDEITEEW